MKSMMTFVRLLFGVNAVRSAQDYTKLSGYNSLHEVETTTVRREYSDEGHFWNDVLSRDKERVPREGDTIRLRGFGLSRWVPRVPGLFWKAESSLLRTNADEYQLPVEVMQPNFREKHVGQILTPKGKTLKILGGVGNVRLRPTNQGLLLVASSSGEYWRGIPVFIRDEVLTHRGLIPTGTMAVITGVWTSIPQEAALGLGGEAGIPRKCLVVNRSRDLELKRNSVMVGFSSAWTLFERRDERTNLRAYDFAYSTFAVDSEESPVGIHRHFTEEEEAGDWLREYIDKFNGRALTDYDEDTPHFDALLPINELMSREVQPERLRSFIEQVKRSALSEDEVVYEKLPELLLTKFNLEDLKGITLDYLGVSLENLVGPVAGKADQVEALIDYCWRQERMAELVAGVLQERPDLSLELVARP
jgi:hypothetical protein